MTIPLGSRSLLFVAAMLAAGCTSTEEVKHEAEAEIPPGRSEQEAEVRFEMRTDTVSAVPSTDTKEPDSLALLARFLFSVQIGAFKDPQNADLVQRKARSRFQLPVMNEFDAQANLYQIRVGLFDDRDGAEALRQAMQTQYPKEYTDCWIVQVRREK